MFTDFLNGVDARVLRTRITRPLTEESVHRMGTEHGDMYCVHVCAHVVHACWFVWVASDKKHSFPLTSKFSCSYSSK